MNMNQLFNMFTRLIARRAMNWGINKGMDSLSRRDGAPGKGKSKGRGGVKSGSSRDLARKMRTLSRLTRR